MPFTFCSRVSGFGKHYFIHLFVVARKEDVFFELAFGDCIMITSDFGNQNNKPGELNQLY